MSPSHKNAHAMGSTRLPSDSPAFAVSILACLIAGLCSTVVVPALAENRKYEGSATDLQYAPSGFTAGKNTFAPTDYLTDNLSNNTLTISNTSGANDPTYVLGGYSASSATTIEKNTVELTNGNVSSDIYGGYSASVNNIVTGNIVSISSGRADHDVYGGYSVSANNTVTGNTVSISGGSVTVGVTGGDNYSGNATGNTVNISGGSVGGSLGRIYGGRSGSGNATNNTVNISDGIVNTSGDVTGGHSNDSSATGNIVNISGGSVGGFGGITGGYGYSHATGNTVNISGGSVGTGNVGSVTGGRSDGNAAGNIVNVSDGSVSYGVTGGSSSSGHATGNTVNISGGSVGTSGTGNVTGGSSGNGNGDATGNIVNISGGSLYSGVIGGNSWYGNGDATGNIVNISGGSLYSGVTGGFSNAGNATGNTVNISGNANIVGVATLYGGDGGGTNKRAGNTLHINNWKGNTKANITNFEHYHFTLPASVSSGANILSTTGSVTLSSQASQQTTVTLDFSGKPAALRPGDKINLIAASSAITNNGTLVNTSAPSTFGATDYLFDVALENGNTALVATLAGKQVNQNKAGVYLYGASARLAALTSGADHVVSLLDNWRHSSQTPTSAGFRSFVSIQGSSIKTRTGSSVNNNGASFALGGALDTATRLGMLTAGVFAEGGIGSYDSYSRFGWGDGDTWHYGIGAFAKHAFTNRLYLEGSARIGRAKADFDGKGSVSDLHYNSEGNYWGAHAGVGVDYPLNTISSVDTYAKLLWTHQDSESVTTRAKERLSFDSADSLRSRIGTRYRHRVEENLRAHVGVGWEYEFDGKARAKLDGTKIAHEPETQGHSALVEAGIEWRATKRWSVNANATAMGGQRRGITGYAQATYRF